MRGYSQKIYETVYTLVAIAQITNQVQIHLRTLIVCTHLEVEPGLFLRHPLSSTTSIRSSTTTPPGPSRKQEPIYPRDADEYEGLQQGAFRDGTAYDWIELYALYCLSVLYAVAQARDEEARLEAESEGRAERVGEGAERGLSGTVARLPSAHCECVSELVAE